MISDIITSAVGPFQENCYIVSFNDPDRSALIIDPGDEGDRLIREIESRSLTPKAILNTHAHVDHVGAVRLVQDQYQIPFYLQSKEESVLNTYPDICQSLGFDPKPLPEKVEWMQGDTTLEFSFSDVSIFATPGHTPGGCVIQIDNLAFTGDTLFAGSVGRTDLPGGDWATLESSLIRIMDTLSDSTRIFPGHGPETTLEMEKRRNPFLNPLVHK